MAPGTVQALARFPIGDDAVATLFEKLEGWLSRNGEKDFIARNGRMLEADLAIARSELAELPSAPCDTRRKMEAMAAVFGLSPGAISKERWRQLDLARTCGHCDNRRECARFLSQGGTADEAVRFCPNAHHYLELKSRTAT